ncbi:MAG: peptidylprolyl isomerase [Asticcacaulis sp.]|uniref:peptidylprolyl isomerase n=1 Tax=Asticcacaulis sp. TaxID=1872648 RepID=UPI0025C3D220|nr:peptidylprolyl isomerase [Asticcacaulis sp.]MCA1936397.1 peptidylprolyl isomerase [Asticcacaulis sp.]
MTQRRQWMIGMTALMGATLLQGCFPAQQKPAENTEAPKAPAKPKPLYRDLPVPPESVRVLIQTTKGDIVVELDGKRAPISTANFLQYVDSGKMTDAQFWRAMKSGKGGFIQVEAAGHRFTPIPHEPTSQTGLSHTDGTISTARYAVGTASNQFTISVGDMSYMDAGRDPEGDNQGYAAFGKVVSGMDVVKKILNGKITKKKIEGGWDGQKLENPVKVLSAKRLN